MRFNQKNLEKVYYSDAAGQIYRIDQSTAIPIPNTKAPSGVSLDFVITALGNFVTGNKPILTKTNGVAIHLDDNSTVRKSIMLQDGRCAFALADGIAFLSTDEKWTKIDPAIFKERCNSLFEDETGNLWIGGNSGLFKYDGISFQPIEEINRNKPRISDIMSWQGYIVCATKTSGLIFYKPGESIFLEEKNGLQSNMTDCVSSYGNVIWVGTASGIQQIEIRKINVLDFSTTLINDAKGLPSNEVNDLLFDQGKLIIATNNGLCVVDPTLPSILASRTEMLIGEWEVNGKPRDTTYVELRWNENSIRIHYRSLYFRTAEKTKYRYRLDGLFSNWIESTALYADFPAMPAGAYTFFVSAMNEDGEWGEEKSLHFIINPHYTQTWWFRLMVAAILVGIIVLAFFFIYRQKKQKLENRAKMSELRQQALNANMNPHFIFNALGSIQHFINTGKGQEASEYLSDFSKLIRMNLETNQYPMVSLQDELERLELYLRLEKLRFGHKMNYSIEIQNNLNLFDLSIPPMLLQPYVENALIHGILPLEDGGMVQISIKGLGDQYEVIILDDGVGLLSSKHDTGTKKQSLAMNMNVERLFILGEMTGQKFKVEVTDRSEFQAQEHGTLVRILIPKDLEVTL
ncbi:MAG: histidine kinase [Flavobacteriales bacterium]|nr:histidine kinase [Flavobacteriales bacterium]